MPFIAPQAARCQPGLTSPKNQGYAHYPKRLKSDTPSADEIARTLKARQGPRLSGAMDTRVHLLCEQSTGQSEITPRQFGVLLTLYPRGMLTLTEIA
jgi:hypothetical protein